MATEQGILQALWGEVRPAVEARSEDLVRPCVALVNRHKTSAALERFAELLAQPPVRERAVLASLSRRTLAREVADADGTWTRASLWQALVALDPGRWGTCRLLLDEPLPDRIWLFRGRSWVLYRWDGVRFSGTALHEVRARIESGRLGAAEAMLTLSVGGSSVPNPKLPPAD